VRLEKISVATFFQDANVRAERKRYAVLQNEALLMIFSSFSNKPFVYHQICCILRYEDIIRTFATEKAE
jgi:hypothetical protein